MLGLCYGGSITTFYALSKFGRFRRWRYTNMNQMREGKHENVVTDVKILVETTSGQRVIEDARRIYPYAIYRLRSRHVDISPRSIEYLAWDELQESGGRPSPHGPIRASRWPGSNKTPFRPRAGTPRAQRRTRRLTGCVRSRSDECSDPLPKCLSRKSEPHAVSVPRSARPDATRAIRLLIGRYWYRLLPLGESMQWAINATWARYRTRPLHTTIHRGVIYDEALYSSACHFWERIAGPAVHRSDGGELPPTRYWNGAPPKQSRLMRISTHLYPSCTVRRFGPPRNPGVSRFRERTIIGPMPVQDFRPWSRACLWSAVRIFIGIGDNVFHHHHHHRHRGLDKLIWLPY